MSVVGSPPVKDVKGEMFYLDWATPEKFIGKNWQVFHNISPNDIAQGNLGDCYLLSAISSLAERPELITRLFDIEVKNRIRLYSVWLNINGLWKLFTLSDEFPCKKDSSGKLQHYSSKTTQSEIWIMLLEKAYAKAYGSYAIIDMGEPIYALRDLTGAPYVELRNLVTASLEMSNVFWK